MIMGEDLLIVFSESWYSPIEKPYKIKIEKYLGEFKETITNKDGSQEETIVHKYKVKVL